MTLKSVLEFLTVGRPIPLLYALNPFQIPLALLLTWADVLTSRCHVKGETFKGDIGDYYQKYYRGNIFLLRGAKSLTLSVALSITFTER